MKITCAVCKDLLPLYQENLCSEDSKKLVEEHIENCTDCKNINKDFDANIFSIKSEDKKDANKESINFLNGVKRKLIINIIKISVISVFIALCGMKLWLYATTEVSIVPYSENLITVEEQADGSVHIIKNSNFYETHIIGHAVERNGRQERIAYIFYTDTWMIRHINNKKPEYLTSDSWWGTNVKYSMNNPDYLHGPGFQSPEASEINEVSAIYYLNAPSLEYDVYSLNKIPDDAILIWEQNK